MYTREINNLTVACLTPEQRERTCSYWFAVQSNHTSETAFRTLAAFHQWLDLLGIECPEELPPQGEHKFIWLKGLYRVCSHLDVAAFYKLEGRVTRWMNNGRYTMAVITRDDDGIRTVHHLNCNCPRLEFDYDESRRLQDAGQI